MIHKRQLMQVKLAQSRGWGQRQLTGQLAESQHMPGSQEEHNAPLLLPLSYTCVFPLPGKGLCLCLFELPTRSFRFHSRVIFARSSLTCELQVGSSAPEPVPFLCFVMITTSFRLYVFTRGLSYYLRASTRSGAALLIFVSAPSIGPDME